MPIDVEITSLDLGFEKSRMRSPFRERQLLLSVMEVGITDPLKGFELNGANLSQAISRL